MLDIIAMVAAIPASIRRGCLVFGRCYFYQGVKSICSSCWSNAAASRARRVEFMTRNRQCHLHVVLCSCGRYGERMGEARGDHVGDREGGQSDVKPMRAGERRNGRAATARGKGKDLAEQRDAQEPAATATTATTHPIPSHAIIFLLRPDGSTSIDSPPSDGNRATTRSSRHAMEHAHPSFRRPPFGLFQKAPTPNTRTGTPSVAFERRPQ